MNQIDRVGTFRGNIVESSFCLTKNGFPQFVARFQADELYDSETEQWMNWSKYDEVEITGYFVLAGKDGNLSKNAEQLQKAVGWSGTSFAELDDADYSETKVQFRVKMDTYNNAPVLKVCWIDHADADPSTTLKKMDRAEIKTLDAKFAKALKAFAGGAKPKAVPAGKPATPKVEKPKTAPKAEKAKTAPKVEEAAAPVGIAAHLNLPAACANADEAWAQVEKHVSKEFPEEQVVETWLKVVEDLGGPDAIEKDNAWANVRDIVLETMSDDPNL